jgi:thiol-disulfide isomerase/thioredoxin
VLALLIWLALVPAGQPAPYLEGKTLEGNSWGASLTGQITIVEFFATWCPHCRRSIEGYARLTAARRVQLIIVDVEEDPAIVQAFFTERRPPAGAGLLVDPDGRIMRQWGVSALPAAFLIDANGTVRDSFKGWGDHVVRDLAEQIDEINRPAPPPHTATAPKARLRQIPKHPSRSRRVQPAATLDERARQIGVEVIR